MLIIIFDTNFITMHIILQQIKTGEDTMLYETGYDRRKAVNYAMKWALSRNPRYYDFEDIGGDCTNFVSQCLFAGCGVMNHSEPDGWYYNSLNDRSPSWTGVEFLRSFLLANTSVGVYGREAALYELMPGDVIMLVDRSGDIYHSVIVSGVLYPVTPGNIFICSHSFDKRHARLSEYIYHKAAGIHITGARSYK